MYVQTFSLCFLGFIAFGSGHAFAQGEPEIDFDAYAASCKAEIEDGNTIHFPALLQCDAGQLLQIEANGVLIPAETNADAQNFTVATECDKPPILDISSGGIGQCVPNSKILIDRVRQDNVDPDNWPYFAFLCRNYKYRSLEAQRADPQYDDLAIILYNPDNKKTCFFQRLSDNALLAPPQDNVTFDAVEAISGTDVISPFEPDADQFWLPPSEVKDINCGACHDANPYIRTPYVKQAVGAEFPRRSRAEAYEIVELDYFGQDWKDKHGYFALDPRGNGEPGKCTMCHSIGIGMGSGTLTDYSTGLVAPNQLVNDWIDTHWMPPAANEANFNDRYLPSVTKIQECHNSPEDAGCNRTYLHQ